MKKKTTVSAIILIGMVLSCSGCATLNDTISGTPWRAYSGPQLPADQVAIIKSSGIRNYFTEAYVSTIDSQAVEKYGGYIETLPGTHNLVVNVTQRLGAPGSILGALSEERATGTITFEAQPGNGYIVDGQVVEKKAAIWIENEKTSQIVAGQKP